MLSDACRPETFTAIEKSASPGICCHCCNCRQASPSTQSPIGRMRSLSSTMSMKAPGLEQAALGMLDAQQRFRSAEPTGRQVDDGLVVQPQPAIGDRVADLLLHLQAFGRSADRPWRKSS